MVAVVNTAVVFEVAFVVMTDSLTLIVAFPTEFADVVGVMDVPLPVFAAVDTVVIEGEDTKAVESITVLDDVGVVTYIFLQQQKAYPSVFPLGQLPFAAGKMMQNSAPRNNDVIPYRNMVENGYEREEIFS